MAAAKKKSESPQRSLIVPCYNEQDALPILVRKVKEAFAAGKAAWELLLIDDGSSDRTPQMIREFAADDPRIKGIILSRNFGHQPALSVGLAHCRGQSVGIIDCDLQDPVEILMKMYALVENGKCDVAYGIRERRDAPLVLRTAYRLFYEFISAAAEHPWPKDAGDFCVMSRRCVDTIIALPENMRMLRGMRSWIGFTQTGVPYERPRRVAGQSHYNYWRLTRLALSGIIGFSVAPLRLASIIGFAGGFLSLLLGLAFLINRLVPQLFPFGYNLNVSPGLASIAILISLIGSMTLICMGILGEYIGVVLTEIKGRPSALAKEFIGFGTETK